MPVAKRLWSDPVWSKVIASGIVAALGLGLARWLDWWPILFRWARATAAFLGAKTPIWNWLIGIVGIVLIVGLSLTIGIAMSARNEAYSIPWPLSYSEDTFLGVKWRWSYAGKEISGLHCLCLKCGLQIYFDDASYFDAVPRIGSRCEDCRNTVGPYDGTYEMLESRVIRMIHRNIREGRAKAQGQSTETR